MCLQKASALTLLYVADDVSPLYLLTLLFKQMDEIWMDGWICVYLYLTKAEELEGSVSKEESFKKKTFKIRNERAMN